MTAATVEVEVDTAVTVAMEEDTEDEVEEREARLANLAVAMVTCLATVPRARSVTTATSAIDLAEPRLINAAGGEVGHMSRDCTQSQKCYNCGLAIDLVRPRLINAAGGEVGHLSRDCPSETSSE